MRNHNNSRRRFLQTALAGSCASGLADFSFLNTLPSVSASESSLPPNAVQFTPEMEPLVRLIEESPREKLMAKIADELRGQVSYRQLLSALLLAGVRNVQPRPSVGFKFHAVLVVNSAHLASISSPEAERWLPIFWALDNFKSSQARDVREGNWTMPAVDEAALPSAVTARERLIEGLENWDEAKTDVSVTSLCRAAGAHELFALFARYGVRDFRSIGHKAIFVANSWRTLQCIGWRNAEPVLRSLAYALLNHEGQDNPSKSDHDADRPWRKNLERIGRISKPVLGGRLDSAATQSLLTTIRDGSNDDAPELVVQLLNQGVSPRSVYDGLMAAAGELLMRQSGIVALHAMTTTNAMHYLFQTSQDDETRKLILLQNAAFLPMFRDSMRSRGNVGQQQIDRLNSTVEAEDSADGTSDERTVLAEVFADTNDVEAPSRALHYLEGGGDAKQFIQTARRLIFLKGTDSHDYKFSSAALEDYYHTSPTWRNRYLAAAIHQLRGNQEPDNKLVERIKEAWG